METAIVSGIKHAAIACLPTGALHVTVSAGTTMSAPPTLSGFSLSQLVSALEAELEKCAQSDL